MTEIVKSRTGTPSTVTENLKDAIRSFIKAGIAEQKAMPRLIFGLDATASRQPTWDLARKLQADMFSEVATIGGLNMQLVYFRGNGECRASRWIARAPALTEIMSKITYRSGITQISRVLQHVLNQTQDIRALVYVGDRFEEDLDKITPVAAALGAKGVPALMLQEGRQAKDKQMEADAAAIKMRATRRLGEMMEAEGKAGRLSKGGRPNKTGLAKNPVSLAELGIDKNLAQQARDYATVPEAEFDETVEQVRQDVAEIQAAAARVMRFDTLMEAEAELPKALARGEKAIQPPLSAWAGKY